MKLMLKEGRFINVGGSEKLHFEPSGIDVELAFTQSVDKVTHVLGTYELKKFENKDIYILYPTLKESISIEEIECEIKKISSGDDSNIMNVEDTTICMPINESGSNTIFWDVQNHVIIIFGKDNLKKLLFMIELSRIPECIHFKNKEAEMKFMEQSCSPVYKKSKNI